MGFIVKCVNHDRKIIIIYDDQDFQRKLFLKMIHSSGHWGFKRVGNLVIGCILEFGCIVYHYCATFRS
jgi:hypothetical protein